MDLYHSEIRLPRGFVPPTARVRLDWTRHADTARTDDRYGTIPRFTTLPLGALQVVEVGMEGNRIAKVLMRGHFNKNIDVCFVLIPGPKNGGVLPVWRVKTVWQNERTDVHKTLDRSRYVV